MVSKHVHDAALRGILELDGGVEAPAPAPPPPRSRPAKGDEKE